MSEAIIKPDEGIKEFLCSKCKKLMQKIENGHWCPDCRLVVVPQGTFTTTVTVSSLPTKYVAQINPHPRKWREILKVFALKRASSRLFEELSLR